MTTLRFFSSRSPSRLALLLIPLVFVCFGFSPRTQALLPPPPPDGGYPRGNTAEGENALNNLSVGHDNTAIGFSALSIDTIGGLNTATGALALEHNIKGFSNTANGFKALEENTFGTGNTAIGTAALLDNTTGERNTAIGFNSLENNNRGNFNVALGAGAGSGVITADDVICIGRSVTGANVNNTCFIGNIRGVTTQNANALPVVIDGAGQLGTMSSSKRFKKEIKPMENASDSLLRLKPVTFHYKSDGTNRPEFGLIAEDVAKVNPDLVVRDDSGEIYTVRYDAVNAMLLNEFLKEHRKVEDLEANAAQQHKEITALAATVKEQAAQIQKVSAKLEMNRSAARTVLNNR